jgi:N-acetylglutamate synthase-like GNAT family acetyltransferase
MPLEASQIRRLHEELRRPKRPVRVSEYLVAVDAERVVGCAAVRMFQGGGYLYGLGVKRELRRRGVGSALTRARVTAICQADGHIAVVLAMFWNVKFFKNLCFQSVRRADLPAIIRHLADFKNPVYKHSAVLWQLLERKLS